MVQRVTIAHKRPEFSRVLSRLLAFDGPEYVRASKVSFIEEHLTWASLPLTMRDIYGGYQCEAALGEALTLRWRRICENCKSLPNAVLRLPPENRLGHYITGIAAMLF